MRDLYSDLHVLPGSNRDAIHSSFRSMARYCHPDFGGDVQRMQRINEAWATLGHPDRRAAYDRQREAERQANQRAATPTAMPQPAAVPDRPATPPARQPNVLDYGRYEGWTIEALADHDPDYLEWLRRSPGGRGWRASIDAALAVRARRMPPPEAPVKRRGRFGR